MNVTTAERPAEVAASTSRLARIVAEPVTVVLMPLFVYFVLEVEPFFRQNGIDPYIYMGYAFDGDDLIGRYDLNYYSVRFGLLSPMQLSTALFGVETGYFVMRYGLALAASGAIYLLLRRHFGHVAGLVGQLLFLTSPMLLRALMTTYSDTTGVPYMAAGGALLLLAPDVRRRNLVVVASGACLALAVHSNLFNLALAGITVVCWLAVQVLRDRWRLLIDVGLLAFAFAAVTAAGTMLYGLRYGEWNILSPSLEAARTYSGDAGSLFKAPTYGWLRFRFHLYLPPLVVLTWLVLRGPEWRRASRAELAAMLTLTAQFMFFVVHEFVLDRASFELYYYTSYLTGSLTIAGAFLLAVLAERTRRPALTLGGMGIVLIGLPFLRNQVWSDFQFHWNPWIPILFVVCVTAAVLTRVSQNAALATALLLSIASVALMVGAPRNPPLATGQDFRFDPYYEFAYGNTDDSGFDSYLITYDLTRIVPELDTTEDHVLFWFPDNSNLINGIQSAYIWRKSALMSTGPGMPFVDEWRVARIVDERAHHLVLLANSQAEIDAGVAALEGWDVVVSDRQPHLLRRGGDLIYSEVVRVEVPALGW